MKDNVPIKKILRLVILIVLIIVIGKMLALYLGNIVHYFL